MPSAIIGGTIGDKLEPKYSFAKPGVCVIGTLLAIPFAMITFMFQINFYVGISTYYFMYLFGECFYGNTFAMVNRLFDSNHQGLAISIFGLCGSFAGGIGSFALGAIGDAYDVKTYPSRMGTILGVTILIAYGGCIPCYILAGKQYMGILEKDKKESTTIYEDKSGMSESQE